MSGHRQVRSFITGVCSLQPLSLRQACWNAEAHRGMWRGAEGGRARSSVSGRILASPKGGTWQLPTREQRFAGRRAGTSGGPVLSAVRKLRGGHVLSKEGGTPGSQPSRRQFPGLSLAGKSMQLDHMPPRKSRLKHRCPDRMHVLASTSTAWPDGISGVRRLSPWGSP